MHEDHGPGKRSVSLPSLTAWLSVCLLAAAWGGTLDEHMQARWGQLGAFGLAASLGLETIHRAQSKRAAKVRDVVARSRVELGLSRLSQESATLDSLNAAVRRLTHQAVSRHSENARKPGVSRRRWESQILSQCPVEVMPIDDAAGSVCQSSMPLPGLLRQISSTAISFEHAGPLQARMTLVTFKLDDQRVSFVVDVIWTEKTDKGFLSGGAMMAVGVPPEQNMAMPTEMLA